MHEYTINLTCTRKAYKIKMSFKKFKNIIVPLIFLHAPATNPPYRGFSYIYGGRQLVFTGRQFFFEGTFYNRVRVRSTHICKIILAAGQFV